MSPEARSRAPFELLGFTAAPVVGALVVLELEGRFPRQSGRFGRQPVLVVEPGDDRPRLELAPVRATVDGGLWHGAYAVPAEALGPGAVLALGLRGTLLELPAPDEPDAGDRLTMLAREANRLRRRLEAAEAAAATAREEAAAATAALDTAVTAARAEAQAASAERIDALEHEIVEAHRLSALDVEAARTTAIADTIARAEAAEQHAEEAESRAREAEERAAAAEQARDEAIAAGDATLTGDMAALVDANARVAEAEAEIEQLRRRLVAAESGTEVLRAELAEERERAEATSADPDPTRPFTVSEEQDADDDATQPFSARDPADGARRLHAAPPSGGDDDDTEDDSGILDPVTPEPYGATHPAHGPNLSRWVAVGALALFAFVLLGLLFGFLG